MHQRKSFLKPKSSCTLPICEKKVLQCCTPQAVEEKKEFVPESMKKKFTTNKLSAPCIKEEDKVHQDGI